MNRVRTESIAARRAMLAAILLVAMLHPSHAQETKEAVVVKVGDAYVMDVSESWIRKEPRSKIVQYEFSIPAVEGDVTDGQVTMMPAGGSTKANIDRWIGQFRPLDGSGTKQQAQTDKKQIAGQTVHFADIEGTYQDKPRGPFGPSVDKPNYRMLGAVIVTENSGSYFVKLYGPKNTIAASAVSFRQLVDSLRPAE